MAAAAIRRRRLLAGAVCGLAAGAFPPGLPDPLLVMTDQEGGLASEQSAGPAA